MEAFVNTLADVIKPPWTYILGVVGLIILVAPRLTEFRREIIDARLGRRRLEIEKLRKRKEIPELKKQVEELSVVSPVETPAPKPEPKSPGRIRRWMGRHPRFARSFLLFAQIVLAYMMVVFAYGMVAMPIMMWPEDKGGPVMSIFLALIYLGLMWLSYKGSAASRSVRKELRSR